MEIVVDPASGIRLSTSTSPQGKPLFAFAARMRAFDRRDFELFEPTFDEPPDQAAVDRPRWAVGSGDRVFEWKE